MPSAHLQDLVNLFTFMLAFDIDRFSVQKADDRIIKAIVGWSDDGSPDFDCTEEVQEIEWEVQKNPRTADALRILGRLKDNKLISIGKILADEKYIYSVLAQDIDKPENALACLLDFHVDMIDCGRKTDYFFLHF